MLRTGHPGLKSGSVLGLSKCDCSPAWTEEQIVHLRGQRSRLSLSLVSMQAEALFSQDANTSELAPYPCLSELSGRLSGHIRAAACRRNLSDTPQLAAGEFSLYPGK